MGASGGAAAAFEGQRSRLVGLAYRMLGMRAEAEDIVQEAYLRWRQAEPGGIDSPEAWLTTVVTRLSIDRLRSAQMRREVYTGPWLPEPIVERRAWSPEARLEARADLSVAFLYLLERLSAEERAAYLLREVFDYPYARVAGILEKSEAACRQLVHRARERVSQGRPRIPAGEELHSKILTEYVAAVQAQDEAALLRLLAADARAVSDGGGKARAALRVIVGGRRVARFLCGISRKNAGRLST